VAVILKALAKEPAERFQDCQQIHFALERFLQSQGAVVTPSQAQAPEPQCRHVGGRL
jgi:hypothetical protein